MRTGAQGITKGQAKMLALLQQRAGVPYSGAGMTRAQAARALRELQAKPKRSAPSTQQSPSRPRDRRSPSAHQVQRLAQLGHDASGLTRREAAYVIAGLTTALEDASG